MVTLLFVLKPVAGVPKRRDAGREPEGAQFSRLGGGGPPGSTNKSVPRQIKVISAPRGSGGGGSQIKYRLRQCGVT
jgi:hypothetical protein